MSYPNPAPVWRQMLFLTALGDRPDSSQSRQVDFTDLSDTGSDIDIDTLVEHSDQNFSSDSHVFEPWIHNAAKGQVTQASGSNHTSMDRNHIDNQIVAQLSALGARLESMESCMK